MSAGCDGAPGEVAEPVVARAGDRVFTSEALAHLLVLAQPLPLESAVAEELSRHWLGLTLVSARWAGGDSLLSALEADAAMSFALRDSSLAELRRQTFPDYETRIETRAAALGGATEPRLIAHVLRRAGPESRPEERELQRRSAERLLAGLRAGRPWSWANEENEDGAARPSGGMIGLIGRGELPPELDGAAFRLEPGSYSDVIESAYGYHILYRPPPQGEWRLRLTSLAADRVAAEIDSVLLEQVRVAGSLAVQPGATATARSIVRDPWRAVGRADTLARLGEAALTAGQFAGFAAVLPADSRSSLAMAGESDVAWFVTTVTEKQSLWQLAEKRGIRVSADAIEALRGSYRADMRSLAADLARAAALDGMDLTAAEMRELRNRRVIQALEGIAARRMNLRPVPPLLMLRLLEQSDWTFDPSAIGPAIQRARILINAARPALATSSSS